MNTNILKAWEFGFYAESGEFFALGESGFDGKTLFTIAGNEQDAYRNFLHCIAIRYAHECDTVREIRQPVDPEHYLCIDCGVITL